jgi:hypothetical protein
MWLWIRPQFILRTPTTVAAIFGDTYSLFIPSTTLYGRQQSLPCFIGDQRAAMVELRTSDVSSHIHFVTALGPVWLHGEHKVA